MCWRCIYKDRVAAAEKVVYSSVEQSLAKGKSPVGTAIELVAAVGKAFYPMVYAGGNEAVLSNANEEGAKNMSNLFAQLRANHGIDTDRNFLFGIIAGMKLGWIHSLSLAECCQHEQAMGFSPYEDGNDEDAVSSNGPPSHGPRRPRA